MYHGNHFLKRDNGMSEAVGWALLFVAVAAVGPGSTVYAVVGDQVSVPVIASI